MSVFLNHCFSGIDLSEIPILKYINRQVEVNQKTKVGLKERFTENIEIEKVNKEEKMEKINNVSSCVLELRKRTFH